jgi:hypothetical protein
MVGFICVFFHTAVMKRRNKSLTKDEIQCSGVCLLTVQTTYPKAYKRTAINSNNYYCAH